jgi:hypothetical protein
MADARSEKPPEPAETEPYYKEVLGEPEESLIVRDRKDSQGKIDEAANTEATRSNLIKEAERLSTLIAEQSSSIPVTKDCSKLLAEARGLISSVSLDSGAVLGKFDAVKYRLLRAYESKKVWPKWFLILLGWNFICLGIIGYFIGSYMLIPGQKNLEDIGFVALACALWGGVGGVVDALFALHTHISSRDFDLRFRPWYFLHPLLGLSLGGVIFLLIQAGLLAIADTQLKEAANASDGVTAGGTVVPIAFAFLAGFKQNTAYEFVGRIVKSVFQKESE